MMKSVEAVVVNWKRPENIPVILEALRPQCDFLTVINAGEPCDTTLADLTVTFSKNFGGINRYNLASHICDYTYFHDDDMLPGSKVIEHFLEFSDKACVLGQIGRIVGERYNSNDVPRTNEVVDVDLIVRGYFVNTKLLPEIFNIRQKFKTHFREDDMVLACAARRLKQRICLTPANEDIETLINKVELPNQFAISSDPKHLEYRDKFWKEVVLNDI